MTPISTLRRLVLPTLFIAASCTAMAQAGVPGTGGAGQGRSMGRLSLGGSSGDPHTPHRTIVGQVIGADGKPVLDAQVYLKNLRDNSVRILAVDDEGKYNFSPLPLTLDFELWAQEGNKRTIIKPVSSFSPTEFLSISLRFPEKPIYVDPVVKKPAATTAKQ
ncbi:carboxypeptidase-like regulatory domain-containing protein [Granulicella cerasi]|uniref:Carboxypeptidase-like regulatory domain-containing protein n=1 Tax=Granulicella cerasi TaxID=741063 RepID=A0ABW1ZDM1_9BACT|nr:carboxypeptidase-like regulatory domain-containing protein [Granulicella cerasi]